MTNTTNVKCKSCRLAGEKLFLKGRRCESEKCALSRRPKTTGKGHRGKSFHRVSEYGLQLREKQKVKKIYSISERQFRRYLAVAKGHEGGVGAVLLSLLERRLDNVLYRIGWADSRLQARQMVRQGKIFIDNHRVKVASYLLDTDKELNVRLPLTPREGEIPEWLKVNLKDKSARLLRLPGREDITENINEQLFLEFYSR